MPLDAPLLRTYGPALPRRVEVRLPSPNYPPNRRMGIQHIRPSRTTRYPAFALWWRKGPFPRHASTSCQRASTTPLTLVSAEHNTTSTPIAHHVGYHLPGEGPRQPSSISLGPVSQGNSRQVAGPLHNHWAVPTWFGRGPLQPTPGSPQRLLVRGGCILPGIPPGGT